MACPLCGDRCTCSATGNDSAGEHTAVLIDPDNNFSSELTERQFASGLETAAPLARPTLPMPMAVGQSSHAGIDQSFYRPASNDASAGEAWRDEVAVRVQAHQARRRRRFDPSASLSLGFEQSATGGTEIVADEPATAVAGAPVPQRPPTPRMYRRIALEMEAMEAQVAKEAAEAAEAAAAAVLVEEPVAETNVIEFPRPATQEDMFAYELAEPMVETPRILDVPDEPLAPNAQAYSSLSNICLDEEKEVPDWIRNYRDEYDEAELDLPLQVAPLRPRLVSALIDSALVLTATALFCVIVLSITKFMPQGKAAALTAIVLSATFWLAYHYAFLVFSGLTPGMQVAQLELCSFEGCYPLRKTRGARAFAMGVSCMSLGMGFAWAAVDEDNLGWHDRITRTYLRLS
ncbi:MAG TPA: RDD family protein [Terriglobales bacterium]|nr:RDD family protein [Terriglobales bacterium]